jgi:hypothetical protein
MRTPPAVVPAAGRPYYVLWAETTTASRTRAPLRTGREPLVLVLLAALWLVVAGWIGVRHWNRLVAETRTELVGVETENNAPAGEIAGEGTTP